MSSQGLIAYHAKLNLIMQQIQNNEEQFELIAQKILETIKRGCNLFVFGASHAGILAEEMTYRAGGLALFNPIFCPSLMLNNVPVTSTTATEGVADVGRITIRHSQLKSGDLIFIHSVSGRNPLTIEAAITAKSIGATVIGITSLETSKRVKSKHSSGKLLHEIADITLDNLGDYGDACVSLEGMMQKVAPTSTIASAAIMHSIVILFCELWLKNKDNGLVPIFASANVEGNGEINKEIMDRFNNNLFYI